MAENCIKLETGSRNCVREVREPTNLCEKRERDATVCRGWQQGATFDLIVC